MIVYLAQAIQAFVMYCVNGTSRSSLLIESTDSMIIINPLGAVIEIRNLSACAMPVINCVQADANELFAFLGAHCCFTVHKGGPSLVSSFFQLL